MRQTEFEIEFLCSKRFVNFTWTIGMATSRVSLQWLMKLGIGNAASYF